MLPQPAALARVEGKPLLALRAGERRSTAMPLAYHITWTTYGTWLPGDERGWVDSAAPGLRAPDPEREQIAALAMAETLVTLAPEQRDLVEQTIRDHCRIRGWTPHAVNARTNHIHV